MFRVPQGEMHACVVWLFTYLCVRVCAVVCGCARECMSVYVGVFAVVSAFTLFLDTALYVTWALCVSV